MRLRIRDEQIFGNTGCGVIGGKFDGSVLGLVLYIKFVKTYFQHLGNIRCVQQ